MPLNPWQTVAKLLFAGAGLLALLGLIFWALSKVGTGGRLLPGDIVIQRPGFALYFPLATGLVISVVLSAIFIIIALLRR